jgi:CBS domain-containing protein
MNILFLLTPKKDVIFVQDKDTFRQVIEKMEYHHYTAVPILDQEGRYVGVVSDEDLLFALKENHLDWEQSMKIPVLGINFLRHIEALGIDKNVKDLIPYICKQNFVPIVDDQKKFIGIVTRQSVINYMAQDLSKKDN